MTAAPSMRVEPEERAALFAVLVRHYGAEVDRRGWVHVKCPNCGKDGTRKDIHFSFSENHGAKCQACGYGANLKQLASKLGLLDQPIEPAPPIVRREPEIKHYAWMDDLPAYLKDYTCNDSRWEKWADYRNVPGEVVARYYLGVGVFPPYSSQCQHPRLMVPMFQGGMPVAFRGRAISCNHAKWLSTSMGGRAPLLYNGAILLHEKDRLSTLPGQFDLADALGPYCRDRVLFIVENPVDCILFESAGLSAVATLGVTMWTQERPWTALLRQARPKLVVIMYDHDLPGNGASSQAQYREMVDAWSAKHNTLTPPVSNGIRLANELNQAGITAVTYRWPESAPIKADPGWLIEKVGISAISDICHL